MVGVVLARSGGDGAGDSVELLLPARPELLRPEHELLPREHKATHEDDDKDAEGFASGMRKRSTAASGGRDRGNPEDALVEDPSASAEVFSASPKRHFSATCLALRRRSKEEPELLTWCVLPPARLRSSLEAQAVAMLEWSLPPPLRWRSLEATADGFTIRMCTAHFLRERCERIELSFIFSTRTRSAFPP